MDTIFSAFVGLGVFELREPHPDFSMPHNGLQRIGPGTWNRFEIRGRGLGKRFEWSDDEWENFRESTEAEQLFRAVQIVQDILDRKPEYARLPPPRGLRP
jgi:hypothetical protein